MDKFIYKLFSIGLFGLTIRRVNKWISKRKIDKLEYALRYGLYNVRKRAIKGLGELNSEKSMPLLIDSLNDKIKIVSFEAMEAIEKIGLTKELEKLIIAKKAYWKEKELIENEAAKNRKKRKIRDIPKWDRPSGQTRENVRKALQKPMNTGKWL